MVFTAEELPVGSTVAVVVGANPLLIRVAVGALGDGAEEEVLCATGGCGNTEAEGVWAVAVDAIGTATCIPDDGACGCWAGLGRCEAKDGGKAEEERGIHHYDS